MNYIVIMDITNRYKIQEFIDKHPEAEKMFNKWINDILIANWRNHAELKQMYASADYVGNNRYVFNIRGNKYRLVAVVVFFMGELNVRFVGTYKEYDKIDCKTI